MIAIVLLGLGMVLVATMFPVAWTRARELTEQTHQASITEAAEAHAKMLGRVDGRKYGRTGSSFAGDLVMLMDGEHGLLASPYGIVTYSDTRVHALNLENIQLGSIRLPRRFVAEQDEINRLDYLPVLTMPILTLGDLELANKMFTTAQVRFESRVYPAMRPRNDRADFNTPDPDWDEMLDARRFAWAVLHRLRKRVGPPGVVPALTEAYDSLPERREFDMYYVMLRRPQPNYRYAQQDPRSAPDPTLPPPNGRPISPKKPVAIRPENDVALPVPWRVQVYFPGPFAGQLNVPVVSVPLGAGLPSEVAVNYPANLATDPMLVDFFPVGAYFVDELTGAMFRVTKRRIAGDNQDHAFLTLDREVNINELDWPSASSLGPSDPYPPEWPFPACDTCSQGNLDPQETLRTVWVFPPPVQAQRGPNETPIFDGAQPVVGIEVRTLSLSPID
jgi:hypothetical protein